MKTPKELRKSVIEQWAQEKSKNPKALLLFQVGDFYEFFNEDAQTVSRSLGLTLTSRGKGAEKFEMAGIPVHAAESYIARLLRMGYSVAVAKYDNGEGDLE